MRKDQGAWYFPAALIRVVDGDTLILEVDLGLGASIKQRLRLANIDTPEVVGERRAAGLAAKDAAAAWLVSAAQVAPDPNWPLVIRTKRADNYGRYIAKGWAKCTNSKSHRR